MYAAAVEHKHLYVTNPNSLPWTNNVIRQQEWVKIIGIKYEIKPPRLICLKVSDKNM
jgi:bromodomain and WD repeat domain-containing protein 1/3